MGACSQIVDLITKSAVQSTAFLLRIAEDSKGKALSEADASLRSSQSRLNTQSQPLLQDYKPLKFYKYLSV